jgi:glycosyltransferase involved in cell wall biosynthesis
MRIGIDATALPPRPVGAGNYIIQLIRSISDLETEHEFIVFAQESGAALLDIQERDCFHLVVSPDQSPGRRLVWEQVSFPGLIRRERIDLLHSLHYTRPLRLPCASVVTFHDMTFFLYPQLHTRAKRLFFPLAIRYSARHADALISVSESTRQDAIRLAGVEPGKIFTVPLGVSQDFHPISDPVARNQIRERYRLPEDFILYVGLVEPRKNLPLLVKSYKALVERGISLPLVIVGRFGWMYQEVLDLVEALGIKERVWFAGYIPQEDLPIVYNLASLFVYPSLYEGFGLPVLEAMACGVPVVATSVSSLPEVAGQAGLLVPPGDETALTQAMQAVLTDPDVRQQLTEKGPQRASQFTWKRTALSTLKVYRHVLDKTKRP